MARREKQILQLLKEKPSTLNELALLLDEKPKSIYKSLRKLFEKDKIVCDPNTRRYLLNTS
jgi:predicted transcriptional regulator